MIKAVDNEVIWQWFLMIRDISVHFNSFGGKTTRQIIETSKVELRNSVRTTGASCPWHDNIYANWSWVVGSTPQKAANNIWSYFNELCDIYFMF